MPIITACPSCNAPAITTLQSGLSGTWMPHDCENCDETIIIEQTHMGGKTYTEAAFVTEVLPDMDDIERIDHPSGEAHIYANPDRIAVNEEVG